MLRAAALADELALSDMVNRAYDLRSEDVAQMWRAASPQMPLTASAENGCPCYQVKSGVNSLLSRMAASISGVVEVSEPAKRTDVRGAETRLLSVKIGLASEHADRTNEQPRSHAQTGT